MIYEWGGIPCGNDMGHLNGTQQLRSLTGDLYLCTLGNGMVICEQNAVISFADG